MRILVEIKSNDDLKRDVNQQNYNHKIVLGVMEGVPWSFIGCAKVGNKNKINVNLVVSFAHLYNPVVGKLKTIIDIILNIGKLKSTSHLSILYPKLLKKINKSEICSFHPKVAYKVGYKRVNLLSPSTKVYPVKLEEWKWNIMLDVPYDM